MHTYSLDTFISTVNTSLCNSDLPKKKLVRAVCHHIILEKLNVTDVVSKKNNVDYLLQLCDLYHFNLPFRIKKIKKQDPSVGILGSAWILEALATNTVIKNNDIQYALTVYELHEQNLDIGLWYQLPTLENNTPRLSYTLNHQLRYAAALSLYTDVRIVNSVQICLDNLEQHIRIHKSGRLFHHISSYYRRTTVHLIRTYIKSIYKYNNVNEILYHTASVYALALLRQTNPHHQFWKSDICKRIIEYIVSKEYISISQDYFKYSYGYHAIGFQLPFIYTMFIDILGWDTNELYNNITDIVQKQITATYNTNTGLFDINSEQNAYILTSRIYELARLPLDIKKNIFIRI